MSSWALGIDPSCLRRFHFGCIGYTTETAAQVEGYSCDLCQGMGAQPTRSKSFTYISPVCSLSLLAYFCLDSARCMPVALRGLLFERLSFPSAATAPVATAWGRRHVIWSCNQVAISLLQPVSLYRGVCVERTIREGTVYRAASLTVLGWAGPDRS